MEILGLLVLVMAMCVRVSLLIQKERYLSGIEKYRGKIVLSKGRPVPERKETPQQRTSRRRWLLGSEIVVLLAGAAALTTFIVRQWE